MLAAEANMVTMRCKGAFHDAFVPAYAPYSSEAPREELSLQDLQHCYNRGPKMAPPAIGLKLRLVRAHLTTPPFWPI